MKRRASCIADHHRPAVFLVKTSYREGHRLFGAVVCAQFAILNNYGVLSLKNAIKCDRIQWPRCSGFRSSYQHHGENQAAKDSAHGCH